MLLFYTNAFFSKFTKLNISTSLFKKGISFSRLTQTIKLSLKFLKAKTCESSHDYFSIFFFHCGECYKSIGSNHADTSVGFHVFTGCDIIGRFLGKSKHVGGKPLNRHHKRNYARLQFWVNMKHCQVPVYLKIISYSLFNISL